MHYNPCAIPPREPSPWAAMNMIDVRSSFDSVLSIARGGQSISSQSQPDLAVYDYHRGGAPPTLRQ